jgi:putative transposase
MVSPPFHRVRRSIRLIDFDYATNAGYVITICTHQRAPLFGTIRDGTMIVSPLGRIVEEEWWRTATLRPDVLLDAFIIMPNHVHGIVFFNREGSEPRVIQRTDGMPPAPTRTLGAIVRGLKSAVTARARREGLILDAPIWQRNYHDRIIRNQQELDRYREYIDNNPQQWELDRYRER